MTFIYLLKQGRITKIGITQFPKDRIRQIEYDTENKVIILFMQRIPYAKNVEKWVKKRYKSRKHRHKGSGKEEWFRLNIFNIAFLLFCFWAIWIIFITSCALVGVALIYIVWN